MNASPAFHALFMSVAALLLAAAFPYSGVVRAAAGTEVAAESEEDDAIEEPAPPSVGELAFWDAILLLDSERSTDQQRGQALLREAAEAEVAVAQYTLGECHQSGRYGFSKNARRAAESFRLSAERGYGPAKVQLGLCYVTGSGVRKSFDHARTWLNAALADAGNFRPIEPPPEFFEKRDAARKARGGADLPPPPSAGPTMWESMCARAHFALALIDDEERHSREAAAHYEAAATWGEAGRAGIPEAASRAAMRYATGRGVERDILRANGLLELSNRLVRTTSVAYPEAQLALAIATLKGSPFAPPIDEALRYAEAAEAAGNSRAKLVRERLEKKQRESVAPAPENPDRIRSG
jgi:TPR repeat protein